MRKIFSFFAALTLSVGLWADDHYVPITIDANTLNGDVVMGKNQTVDDVWMAGHIDKGLDEHACFYSNNCASISEGNLSHGLPASVEVPNLEGVKVPFNFAWTGTEQFDGNDAIHLISDGETVTVDLKGGNAYKGLYFLATAGNAEAGSSSITVTITYLDETSVVSDFDVLDWCYNIEEGKPTNALQEFYRCRSRGSVEHFDNGPCLYCLSLNDALDPIKPIKSLTFTQTNDKMCTAIFAITGILNGCSPQAPKNTDGIYSGNTTTITFDEVTKDLDDNDITGVTYVYDVARDSNFIKMLDGHTNQPLSTTITAGKVTGTINTKLNGLYIRVRAKNACGVSVNSDVIVNDDAEYFTVTIPGSVDYSVLDYLSNARYLSGETISFTAQILADGKDIAGWKDNHGTVMSATSQVSFTITQDTTIVPILKPEEREFTLATGVTGKMGTLNKDYPWMKTAAKPGLAYRSSNKGQFPTESRDTLVITPTENLYYTLSFDYVVSSSSWWKDCGYMSIWVNNVQIVNEIYGEESGSYNSGLTFLQEPGQTTTIVMSYKKDEDYADGDDCGYIYNIHVTATTTPPAIYTVTVLENEDGTVTGLVPEGKYISGDEVSLTATPNNIGFELKEWQDGNGNQISTANPLTFTITQDTTVKPIYQVEQRSYEIATGVTAQMGTLDKDYPWTKTIAKPGLAYMSTSKGIDDDVDSRDTLVITPEANKYYRLKFDYAVNSDSWCGYDCGSMYIWVNDEPIVEEIYGTESGSYDSNNTFLIEPGQTATIVMSYKKYWSDGNNDVDDRGYIYNIQVISYDTPPAIYTVTVLENEDGTVTGLVPEGKYISGDEASLIATPNIGFELKEWQDGNGTPISTANPLTFTVTQDTIVKPIYQVEQRSYEIATSVTAQIGTLDKDYPWTKTIAKPGLAYMSTNKDSDGTDSRDTLVITPQTGVSYRLKFDYAVSSEGDFDFLSIWVNKKRIARLSGEDSDSYDSGETLLTGPTTIVMSYAKEEYSSWGDDRGYIYNIQVISNAPQIYTRDVTEGNWGTICLPWASTALEGGIFYDVLGTIHAEYGVALTEIEEPNQLEAGKPYVFKATSNQIKVTYYPLTQVEAPVYDENHLYGSFVGCDVPEGKYIIYNNMLYITDGSSTIGTNRAYFDVEEMDPFVQSQAPARVVFFGGRQAPTGFGQWNKEQGQKIMKVVENGQFMIVRDGKTYNAQGQRIQ